MTNYTPNRCARAVALACTSLALNTLWVAPTHAADKSGKSEIAQLKAQLARMQQLYEQRIAALENKLNGTPATRPVLQPSGTSTMMVADANDTTSQPVNPPPAVENVAPPQPQNNASAFNPEISLILSGNYTNLKHDPDQRRLQGFIPSGGEKLPETRGFHLGESELAIAANVDHLFRGNFRMAVAPDNTIGVEEASIQTLGLDNGFNVKAGRFLSGIGYQNELHPHQWDFSDAPLPYQAFFGNALGFDGVQARWLAPTDFFLEFGGETGRSRSFPNNETSNRRNGQGSGALFAHVGGDVGLSHSWRAGVSYLFTRPNDRDYEDVLNNVTNRFSGTSKTWVADLIWKWAPNGNSKHTSLKLQGEFFQRQEDGTLTNDPNGAAQTGNYQSRQSGFYTQAVYQFMPQWRVGYRYDQLNAGNTRIGLVDNGTLTAADFPQLARFTPKRHTVMLDWSPSEYSRIRLQLADDKTRPEVTDRQIWLQYIMSLGAHGAHRF